jgi:metal-responsive CopG/Arc/MetJ family transcriptional regulator
MIKPAKTIKTVGVSFPPNLLEELDKVREDVPRSKFIQRLVENNLFPKESFKR